MDNLNINFSNEGQLSTNDEDLNNIIRAIENENGGIRFSSAMNAVSFGDDPDEKIYLVLLSLYPSRDNEEYIKDWRISIGRQNTYDFLRDLVKNEAIDPNNSFILNCDKESNDKKDNIILNNVRPITVFRFLKVMFDNNKVLDDTSDFDINEFDPCDYETGDNTILSNI